MRLSHIDRSNKQRSVHDIRALDDSSDEQLAHDAKSITESQIDLMENGHAPGSVGSRSEREDEVIQVTRTFVVSRSEKNGGPS